MESAIPSVTLTHGVAVLKIGEGDAPDNAPLMRVNYSWRKWDIIGNKEIARLQDCASPFDAFIAGNDRAA
jgi:hypothetical protein